MMPTLRDLGYDLVANSWFDLSGPPGQLTEIAGAAEQRRDRVLARPDVRSKFDADGITSPPTPTPAAFSPWSPRPISASRDRR